MIERVLPQVLIGVNIGLRNRQYKLWIGIIYYIYAYGHLLCCSFEIMDTLSFKGKLQFPFQQDIIQDHGAIRGGACFCANRIDIIQWGVAR